MMCRIVDFTGVGQRDVKNKPYRQCDSESQEIDHFGRGNSEARAKCDSSDGSIPGSK